MSDAVTLTLSKPSSYQLQITCGDQQYNLYPGETLTVDPLDAVVLHGSQYVDPDRLRYLLKGHRTSKLKKALLDFLATLTNKES